MLVRSSDSDIHPTERRDRVQQMHRQGELFPLPGADPLGQPVPLSLIPEGAWTTTYPIFEDLETTKEPAPEDKGHEDDGAECDECPMCELGNHDRCRKGNCPQAVTWR